jgi:hypothetical protein
MKSVLLRSVAAVAIVFSCGLTAPVDAEERAGPGQAPIEQTAGVPQDVRGSIVIPAGRRQQSTTVERQQVPVGDGETVTVLRPLAAVGEKASGQANAVQREMPVGWQMAAGRRLWLIDPATGDLRTCAVRNTSTVGVDEIRCFSVSGARF